MAPNNFNDGCLPFFVDITFMYFFMAYVSLEEGVRGVAIFRCREWMTPSMRENVVNVPPMIAHSDVMNSYHLRPACVITTAVGDKSYENLASGTLGSALY